MPCSLNLCLDQVVSLKRNWIAFPFAVCSTSYRFFNLSNSFGRCFCFFPTLATTKISSNHIGVWWFCVRSIFSWNLWVKRIKRRILFETIVCARFASFLAMMQCCRFLRTVSINQMRIRYLFLLVILNFFVLLLFLRTFRSKVLLRLSCAISLWYICQIIVLCLLQFSLTCFLLRLRPWEIKTTFCYILELFLGVRSPFDCLVRLLQIL